MVVHARGNRRKSRGLGVSRALAGKQSFLLDARFLCPTTGLEGAKTQNWSTVPKSTTPVDADLLIVLNAEVASHTLVWPGHRAV